MTALVVLTSGLHEGGLNGAALTSAAFTNSLGGVGGILLSVSLVAFAFSAIIGWSYYGERSLGFLTNNNNTVIKLYKLVFSITVLLGATLDLSLVWDISDTLNGLIAIPNLIGVLMLSGIVFKLTKDYLKDPASIEMND